jgi:ABC-type glycerol-3-phosphate transport system permease component
MTAAEPSGRRPRHLTWGRVGVYAFLLCSAAFFLLPLWIMLLTSVKTMDEIRLGNILALPADPTLQPWIAAWSEACTGLACEGIQVGMTLLFRNFYSSLPRELFNAARIDGGGFMTIFLRVILPMSTPMLIVATILQVTGIWNDFILGLTFAGRENLPMTVQLNNIVNSIQGERAYNVDMAATMLTALVPLVVYFVSGRWFVRGIAAGAVKG